MNHFPISPLLSSITQVCYPLLLALLLAALPAAAWGQINIFLGGAGAGDNSNVSAESLALPLTLLSFTAEAAGSTAVLEWQTENERELEGFRLERSTDGQQFEVLGNLPAASVSAPGDRRSYRFTDQRPLTGSSFYRLRMVYLDGSTTYSDLQRINFTSDDVQVSLSPNPAYGGEVLVHLASQRAGEVFQLRIFDELGRVTYAASHRTASTNSKIAIPVTLPRGNYFVRLQRESGGFLNQKLVVLR